MNNAHSADGKLKVVLDTNVYISFLTTPHSSLAVIFEYATRKTYHLLTSPYIVGELARTLRGKPFFFNEASVQNSIRPVVKTAVLVRPLVVPTVILHDPDDDHILACAEAGNADLIVTGDRDLLRLKEYNGIPIVRPKDFVRALGGL